MPKIYHCKNIVDYFHSKTYYNKFVLPKIKNFYDRCGPFEYNFNNFKNYSKILNDIIDDMNMICKDITKTYRTKEEILDEQKENELYDKTIKSIPIPVKEIDDFCLNDIEKSRYFKLTSITELCNQLKVLSNFDIRAYIIDKKNLIIYPFISDEDFRTECYIFDCKNKESIEYVYKNSDEEKFTNVICNDDVER